MAYRVAVGSSDGQNIDLHFGETYAFYIYDVEPDGFSLVEKRSVFRNLGHDAGELDLVLKTLGDCSAVIAAKIGPGAAKHLLQNGLRVFEAPYPVEAVLHKLAGRTDL